VGGRREQLRGAGSVLTSGNAVQKTWARKGLDGSPSGSNEGKLRKAWYQSPKTREQESSWKVVEPINGRAPRTCLTVISEDGKKPGDKGG